MITSELRQGEWLRRPRAVIANAMNKRGCYIEDE
jgi:hypothetical protein